MATRTILDDLVERSRNRVASARSRRSVASLEAMPGWARTRRPFARALRGERLSVIAEVKKASPSQGVIRPDFDPVRIAESYEEAGAAAVSVLTEPERFQGSLDDLLSVSDAVSLAVLRKDFLVDPYQVYEARAFGADAVLLIAAVLERSQLAELLHAADEVGLECLVELYEERELDRVDFDLVRVLGVNNRDLRTFEVDIDHAVRVLGRVPADVVRVAESGLRTASDLAHVRGHGIDAVLMGETLMRAEDPGSHLARLRDETEELLQR